MISLSWEGSWGKTGHKGQRGTPVTAEPWKNSEVKSSWRPQSGHRAAVAPLPGPVTGCPWLSRRDDQRQWAMLYTTYSLSFGRRTSSSLFAGYSMWSKWLLLPFWASGGGVFYQKEQSSSDSVWLQLRNSSEHISPKLLIIGEGEEKGKQGNMPAH